MKTLRIFSVIVLFLILLLVLVAVVSMTTPTVKMPNDADTIELHSHVLAMAQWMGC